MSSKTSANSSFKIDGVHGELHCSINQGDSKNLSKSFEIKIGSEDCGKVISSVTEGFAKTAKINGFRPGKVPIGLVKQQHFEAIMSEAAKLLVKHSSFATTKDHKVAGEIDINIKEFDEQNGLEYEVSFESLPEFELPNFDKIKLTRLVCEPSDKDVEKSLKDIADRFKESEPAPASTKAKSGDIVLINFVGKIDGVEFAGGAGKEHKLELGSGSFIDNFEHQLVGTKAGERKTVSVTFPLDYHSTEFAGKKAEFEVEVIEVHNAKPAKIDDELARKLGLTDLKDLEQKLKEQIVGNLSKVAHDLLKKDLFDELEKHCKFDCPEKMLQAEIDAISGQFDQKSSSDKGEVEKVAARRVKLGLMLSSVASKEKLEIKDKDLQQQLLKIVSQYPGQEKSIIDFYQKNQQALASLKGPAIEEKAVEFILSKTHINDKKISADDLVKMAQEA